MCGIIGYVGNSNVKTTLINGLKKLEYRGYDSAGLSLFTNKDFQSLWAVGPVQELEDRAKTKDWSASHQGIAHTRWATHGVPNEVNAHPHIADNVSLVHNGIIENHAELREALKEDFNLEFRSQTDTEVFAHLLNQSIETVFQDLEDSEKNIEAVKSAMQKAADQAHGHYSVIFMHKNFENTIFGIQRGAPLVAGKKENELYVASDIQALLEHTKNVYFAPENSLFVAQLTENKPSFDFYSLDDGSNLDVLVNKITWDSEQTEKGGYEHFMLKEIFEQPNVIADTLSGQLPVEGDTGFVWDFPKKHAEMWKNCSRVYIVACGTAYYAALVAKYHFEKWARVPVDVDLASEFRYRNPVLEKNTLVGVISQSGETADTLAALRLAKKSGVETFSVCNVPASTISREVDYNYQTKAGPEISVASTKAFTTQLTLLTSLALYVGSIRQGSSEALDSCLSSLPRLPMDLEVVLKNSESYLKIGASLTKFKTILLIGRGLMYPIALEGALKIKEISYKHAEGYAAGELKHGPIALVEKDTAAIVIAPPDANFHKTLANLEEIKARKGHIIGIGDKASKEFREICDEYIEMPTLDLTLTPVTYVVPLQLMAYGLAKELGTNIDKPRNLAKSVTVE